MTATLSVADQVRQLNDARKLVLRDVKFYQNVVQGILPIIGPHARLELRRWGADFLAEAFATPALPSADKETMLLYVLDTLMAMLDNPAEDAQVLRNCVQTAASIYPLAMRWIINNSYDTMTWEKMTTIKARILRIWDSAVPSVRICCIKFAQRVVLAQSASSGVEPRRGDGLDVSLDKVPQNHQSLDHRALEAEAAGLLDRMLGVLQDNSSDALLVDATLNCLAVLVRTRPATANRILNAVLNFNPLKLANSPMTSKTRVFIRSMEKTTRMLLIHVSKRDPHNQLIPRIQQYLEKMNRTRTEIFDEASRKRALEAAQYVTEAKRPRITAASVPQLTIAPLAPGPHSVAEIFTLTTSPGLKGFDASLVPAGLAAKISVSTLARVDGQLLQKAIEGIKARFTAMADAPPPVLNPDTSPLDVEDDDDDYEPDYYAAEDTEQILNKLDSDPSKQLIKTDDDFAVKAYKLPPPDELSTQMGEAYGNDAVERLLDYLKGRADGAKHNPKAGINRLAARFNDRESWFAFASRLASRRDEEPILIKDEDGPITDLAPAYDQATHVREVLFKYVMEDFRKRIDHAVSWLNEEWYAEQGSRRAGVVDRPANYEKWALKLIDGMLPYLTPQDKVLTRFFSELPELTAGMLARIKNVVRDPSLTTLALTTLLYLVMMRPPVKEMALDVVQDIWSDYEDARPMAAKYLTKYRPAFLEAATSGGLPGPAVAAAPAVAT